MLHCIKLDHSLISVLLFCLAMPLLAISNLAVWYVYVLTVYISGKISMEDVQKFNISEVFCSVTSHIDIPYILYLSILKLGTYTHKGSNICRVVQQSEWNKYLGLFKRWVPKLVNLINITWCHTLRKISLFSISLLMHASSFWMLL